MVHVRIGSHWRRTTANASTNQHAFKTIERTVCVDEIVSIQYDCSVLVARVKPQIMPCVLIQETAEAVKELLDRLTVHFRTLVPTQGRIGAACMQYVEELVRTGENPRQQ